MMSLLLCYRYQIYRLTTANGGHGATTKYWLIYIELIALYHEFTRAIRTGDFSLYTNLLPEINKLFFVFNHHNYARWGVRYELSHYC
jgi:hypothetical protein